MLIKEAARIFADALIQHMHKAHGMDYSSQRQFIEDWAAEDMWNGDWDVTINFDEGGPRDLRFIQEDEYEQHMDEDEDRPENDIGYVDGYYVFFA